MAGLAAADLRTGSVASRGVVNGSIAPIDTNGLVPSGKVLWAVDANGTVSRSSKSLTVTAEGGGDYEVQFGAANLDPCASVAQISKSSAGAGAPGPGEAATNQGENFETDIDVRTFNSAGTGTDLPFTVYVLCP